MSDSLQEARRLRRRAELGRLVGLKTHFYELPQVVQEATYGIAGELEEIADSYEALAQRVEDAERENERLRKAPADLTPQQVEEALRLAEIVEGIRGIEPPQAATFIEHTAPLLEPIARSWLEMRGALLEIEQPRRQSYRRWYNDLARAALRGTSEEKGEQ